MAGAFVVGPWVGNKDGISEGNGAGVLTDARVGVGTGAEVAVGLGVVVGTGVAEEQATANRANPAIMISIFQE